MQRISSLNRVLNLFGIGKSGFRNGDLASGIVPTEFNADWCNGVQEELVNVIEAGGIAPSQGSLSQLLTALRGVGVFETAAQFNNGTKAATTAFVKRQGMNFAFQTNIAITTTLTALQHVGALVLGNASTLITLTLPLASTVASGGCIAFQNAGTAPTTFSRQGADVIYVGAAPLTGITVQSGEYVLFETDGFNWTASGTGVLKFSESLNSFLGVSSSWKKYPDKNSPTGYIIEQWGLTGVLPANSALNVIFPMAFPTECSFVSCTVNDSGSIANYRTSVAGQTTTGFNIVNAYASTLPGAFWLAKGK